MTTNNLALYRLLVKLGAKDEDAEAAAVLDTSELATKGDIAELKGDLKSLIAEGNSDLMKSIWTAMVTLTVIFSAISAALRFIK